MLLLLPALAHADGLTYELTGLDGALRRNALAWLGDAPDAEAERQNFVASARQRVSKSLQALGYYRPDIDVEIDRERPQWQMTIQVDPGQPVRIGEFEVRIDGAAGSDPAFDRLLADPGIASGEVLHHGNYEKLRNRLLSLAQQRGYFDAAISHSRVAVNATAGTADIALHLDSGPRFEFGNLRFDETLVSANLLAALRTFQTGEPYDRDQLRTFQQQLQRTGYFSAVLVEPVRTEAAAGRIPIDVSLHPAKRHSIDAGIGYSTDTEGRLSLAWRTPRLNRFGHSQQTRLVYSAINPSGRLNYTIPLTHPLDDLLQLWARLEQNEFGDQDSEQREVGGRRERRLDNWLTGVSLRALEESWKQLDTDNREEYLLFGGSLSRRFQRGPLVDPSRGLSQLYTLEVASRELGSAVELVRATALLRYVVSPLPRHRLVSRAELGIAEVLGGDRRDLAPSLNFFAGGNQSIRGFGYQSIGNEIEVQRSDGRTQNLVLGGDRLAVMSLEYQYYVTDTWRGALFADGGDAFDEGNFDWNYGVGVGVHYLSPVGAIRLEVARDLSEDDPTWRLHLNIGAEF